MSLCSSTRRESIATWLLLTASVLVGISIVTDGNLARVINLLSGIIWFTATAIFLAEGWGRSTNLAKWAVILLLTAMVAFVIRPSDLFLAMLGFIPAGFVAWSIFRGEGVFWAKLVPALYLPMHIGTAVIKAIGRNLLDMESNIRTEPPPTAAIVPFVMVVSAILGGYLAARVGRPRR